MFQVVTPASTSKTRLSSGPSPTAHHVHLSGHQNTRISDDDDDYPTIDDEESNDYSSNNKLATPGQILGSLATYMRGHGTHLIPPSSSSQPAHIASSLTGRIILTNRLLSLQPFFTRYAPETGDLVLGQVLSVLPGARRWKIDIASSSHSNLALSSINLPGGIQRRKLASDELQMRTFFKEGDLLVAEVQGVYNDGSTSLHTRSLRYGKLRNGRLVVVPCRLVRRGKSHFIRLQQGSQEIEMILGLNGWIWLSAVGAMQGSGSNAEGTGRDIDAGATYSDALNVSTSTDIDSHNYPMSYSLTRSHNPGLSNSLLQLPSSQTLDTLSTLSNLLHLLADAYLPISDQSVQCAWDVYSDIIGDDDDDVNAAIDNNLLLPAIKADLASKGILTQAATSNAASHQPTGQDGMDWEV